MESPNKRCKLSLVVRTSTETRNETIAQMVNLGFMSLLTKVYVLYVNPFY